MPDTSPTILPTQFIITLLIGISTTEETMQAMTDAITNLSECCKMILPLPIPTAFISAISLFSLEIKERSMSMTSNAVTITVTIIIICLITFNVSDIPVKLLMNSEVEYTLSVSSRSFNFSMFLFICALSGLPSKCICTPIILFAGRFPKSKSLYRKAVGLIKEEYVPVMINSYSFPFITAVTLSPISASKSSRTLTVTTISSVFCGALPLST